MAGVERTELMRSGKERDIDERKRHCAMDVIAKIAVLALGAHPHAGARAAVGRRRLHAHRQRFDESVERSEEHTSELHSLMRSSYAVFSLKKKKTNQDNQLTT